MPVKKYGTHLEHWAIVYDPRLSAKDIYMAPELQQHLTGQDKPDHTITTSRIVGRRGGGVVTRSGSVYTLGEIDPEYVAKYPGVDIKAKLLASLPEC